MEKWYTIGNIKIIINKGEMKMYQTIINIKSSVQIDTLKELHLIAKNAFSNRAGKLNNVSDEPYCLIFEGDENYYGCLELGTFSLRREYGFIECIHSWQWIDADPDESCNMLEVFARHTRAV